MIYKNGTVTVTDPFCRAGKNRGGGAICQCKVYEKDDGNGASFELSLPAESPEMHENIFELVRFHEFPMENQSPVTFVVQNFPNFYVSFGKPEL